MSFVAESFWHMSWCVVDLLDGRRIAGKCTLYNFGNMSFVEIEVPPLDENLINKAVVGFKKIIFAGIVKEITIIDEEDVVCIAKSLRVEPLS